jgi:NAD(P)-dependent dehydrogenase (short-subunit alcohol dehydrogenase family)
VVMGQKGSALLAQRAVTFHYNRSRRDGLPNTLRRWGDPKDVATAYAWLASDEALFVTGTVLSADGGIVVGT